MTPVNLIAFVLILSLLVFIHELGHFLVARRHGIVTEEFGMGYPPRLLTLFRGQGRLVIAGQTVLLPRGQELPAEIKEGTLVVYETTVDAKGREVLSRIEPVDPAARSAARAQRVELVDPGTIYSLNLIPFGGFVRMRGEDGPAGPGSFASASRKTRAATLVAGPAMNLLFAVLIFSLSFMLGRPEPVPGGRIEGIAPGSPAEAVGLQVGDRIFAIDGQEVRSASDLAAYIRKHPGQQVTLRVLRQEQWLEVSLTPRYPPPPDGAIGIIVYPVTKIQRFGPLAAIRGGFEDVVSFARFTLAVPAMLLRGAITPADARPVGPKAIYDLTSGAIDATVASGWWYPILQLMGILSAALAVTNLLPLPALDGGRLLFVIIEQIRGRRIDPMWEGAIHLAGMVFLLGLMVIITYQDFVSPVPTPDWLAPIGQ